MISDFSFVGLWWAILFLLGVSGMPLAGLFFKNFPDKGYAFSKIISIAVPGYLMFLLSTVGVLKFSLPNIFLILTLFIIFNTLLLKTQPNFWSDISKNKKLLFKEEMLFALGLIFWAYIRAHQPDIRGLEKFMDFGFINSLLRSEYLPPSDMWFAGEKINYYWFGHFVVAFLTKLSAIKPSVSYNLMLGSILGISLSGSFSLIYTLLFNLKVRLGPRTVVAGALISAMLLNFAGNLHTPYYLIREGRSNYWYPDATRFIGYNPDVDDKTIHEFPLYSYVVADLHAHLINLPFVLLYIAILYTFVGSNTAFEKSSKSARGRSSFGLEIRNYREILLLGFILGIMFMTSTWDFGNYILLSGLTFLIFNIKKYSLSINVFFVSAGEVLSVFFLGIIFSLPFILNFKSIAEGVDFVHTRSPIWQLMLLWGIPAVLAVTFTIMARQIGFKKLKREDLFVFSMLISSWVLIAIPEIIYVKDIYIASHYRANTMFKLTYQAFVMSYLSSGYVAIRTIHLQNSGVWRGAAVGIFALTFSAVMTYPNIAIKSYYEGVSNYRGLDGEMWLERQYPEYYDVLLYLRENVEKNSIILEAPGDSYTDYNVISSYSGIPTVSGWFVHEWLWRGSADFPQQRVVDITQIYNSSDPELTKNLLRKYSVDFVIVGAFEKEKFTNINEVKFADIAEGVFKSGNTSVYKIN
jgi:uncharacterized membrane protein